MWCRKTRWDGNHGSPDRTVGKRGVGPAREIPQGFRLGFGNRISRRADELECRSKPNGRRFRPETNIHRRTPTIARSDNIAMDALADKGAPEATAERVRVRIVDIELKHKHARNRPRPRPRARPRGRRSLPELDVEETVAIRELLDDAQRRGARGEAVETGGVAVAGDPVDGDDVSVATTPIERSGGI